MKNFIKAAAAVIAAAVPISAYGAGLTVKSFDVSGGSLKVTGAVETIGEQVSLVISSDNGYEGIYQSISGPNGEFGFDITANDGWSRSYTAKISCEDSEASPIAFSGDGKYVTYTEPQKPAAETGKTTVSGTAYGNRIKINGCIDKTKVTDKNVTLVIYKRGSAAEPSEEDIRYIEQTVAGDKGEFTFEFNFLDDIRFYKMACFAGGENISEYINTAKASGGYITADITLEAISEGKVDMAKISANLENLGYDAADYMMIITVYDSTGFLIDVMKSDKKTIEAGAAVSDSFTSTELPYDAATVKAMLWSVGETLIPLDTSATLNVGR